MRSKVSTCSGFDSLECFYAYELVTIAFLITHAHEERLAYHMHTNRQRLHCMEFRLWPLTNDPRQARIPERPLDKEVRLQFMVFLLSWCTHVAVYNPMFSTFNFQLFAVVRAFFKFLVFSHFDSAVPFLRPVPRRWRLETM